MAQSNKGQTARGDGPETAVKGSKTTNEASSVPWILGIGLLVAACYALTSAGRLDIIDGQYRFEAARMLYLGQGLTIEDPAIKPFSPVGVDGNSYCAYAPGGSILALPMLYLAELFGGGRVAQMFFFSLASAMAAGVAASAYAAIVHLYGFSRRKVLISSAILAAASPMWFLGTTVFHQAQYTALIMVGLWLSLLAAKKNHILLFAAGGLIAGFSIYCQESAAILMPWLAAPALFMAASWRRRLLAVGVSGVSSASWLGMLLLSNYQRYGDALNQAKLESTYHPPLWGDFLQGMSILTFSQGKSWLLYCPTFILALAAARFTYKRFKGLTLAVLGMWFTQYFFHASITFAAGDWTWGPRYLAAMAPILTLLLPWVLWRKGWSVPTVSVVLLSLGIQTLSITMDHQRFFFDRGLSAFFWYSTPGKYFEDSQLFARVPELEKLRLRPVPETMSSFRPGPNPNWSTYTTYGVHPQDVDYYGVFHLPRPWPLWSRYVPEKWYPVPAPSSAIALFLAMGLLGVALIVNATSPWLTPRIRRSNLSQGAKP